jgi:O-antigen biosynthesis protein
LVSVIIPIYNSNERYLVAAVDSVRAQTYSNWELVIIDDGSPEPHVAPMIERIAERDTRIRWVRLENNNGIAEATNAGLSLAHGEFVAFADHDDVLVPTAIAEMVRTLIDTQADAAYSDQAYLSAWNTFESAFHKPNWSPALLSGVMYVGHLLMVRRDIAHAVGGFDSRFDRLQDFEFMLRIGEHTKQIAHVPKILYQWRSIPGSIAHDANSKGKIEPLQAAAVNAHFARVGFQGEAEPHENLPHRLAIRPKPRHAYPHVHVLVRGDRPAQTIAHCMALLTRGRQTLADISVIASNSYSSTTPIRARARRTVRPGDHDSNGLASATPLVTAIQEALHTSTSRYVVFIDPIVQVTDDTWLEHLLLYAEHEDVAFVAPHLYFQDGRVAAAGLLVRENGLMPAMTRFRLGEDGVAGSLACNREVSALPAGMMIIDRTVFDTVGGLDPDFSTPHYIFGDAAVRAMKSGYRNIAIATPILRVDDTYDLVEPDTPLDAALFQEIHADIIRTGDPYYNVNFLPGTDDYLT